MGETNHKQVVGTINHRWEYFLQGLKSG